MTDAIRIRDQIARTGASLFDRGPTAGSSGNRPVRLRDGCWLMTPTNVSLANLGSARLAHFDAGGRHVLGDAPTKEAILHFAIYFVSGDSQFAVEELDEAEKLILLLQTQALRSLAPGQVADLRQRFNQT